jgi:hypothetical protein
MGKAGRFLEKWRGVSMIRRQTELSGSVTPAPFLFCSFPRGISSVTFCLLLGFQGADGDHVGDIDDAICGSVGGAVHNVRTHWV